MNKVNQYVLEHWNEYQENGVKCFESEYEAKFFLSLIEHCGVTLDDLHDDPEVFLDKIFWYYGACDNIHDLVDACNSFGALYDKDGLSIAGFVWKSLVDCCCRDLYEDAESIWEEYDGLIRGERYFETWIFETEEGFIWFGFC